MNSSFNRQVSFKRNVAQASFNSSRALEGESKVSNHFEEEQFNLNEFIINQHQLNTLFKSFLEYNLEPETASKNNTHPKKSEDYLSICNYNTKQRMKYGKEFKGMLDPRDQILQHNFNFFIKINTEDISSKGFLSSETYKDILDKIQQFFVQTIANILSVSFRFLSDEQLEEKEVKNYAASNIMLNIQSVFSKTMEAIKSSQRLAKIPLNQTQLKEINVNLIDRMETIIKNILINKAAYYPQAPISGGTLRMNKAIHEVNRVDDQENDLIYSNEIKISKYLEVQWNEKLHLREDQDYTGFIMEVINAAIKVIQTCEEDSRQRTNKQIFTQFNKQMFALSQVQSFKELLQIAENGIIQSKAKTKEILRSIQEQPGNKINVKADKKESSLQQKKDSIMKAKLAICRYFQRIAETKQIQQKSLQSDQQINLLCQEINKQRQKGLEQLKDYGIGFKIPNYVKPFTRQQIALRQFKPKHSSVLRILTKWAQYLEDIFINAEQHIMKRLYPFKDIHNNLINITQNNVKRDIIEILKQEHEKVNRKLEQIKVRNIELVSLILSKGKGLLPYNIYRFTQTRQVSSKINAVLTSLMVQYLSVLIHHLLAAGKDTRTQVLDEDGNRLCFEGDFIGNINLVVFRVSDLLRAKFKCSQSSFIRILKTMHLLDESRAMKGKFKLVRIKNRLEDSANDIMINYMFMGKVLCQLQLSIQQSKGKQKNYYLFSHFIYELTRGNFGIISQCAIMISQLDPIVNSCNQVCYKQKNEQYKLKNIKQQEKNRGMQSNQQKTELIKTGETIFFCEKCQDLIIKEKQELLQKTEGLSKCMKCLLSQKQMQNEADKQIEANINTKNLPQKQLIIQFLRQSKMKRITRYQDLARRQSQEQQTVYLRVSTAAKMQIVVVVSSHEEMKHFVIKVTPEILKKINDESLVDFSEELDYINVQKLIKKSQQINDHLLYRIDNDQAISTFASKMQFDQKDFKQQVAKLISRFTTFRIQKNLIKSIKFKAQIIYFNQKEKWACFQKVAKLQQAKQNISKEAQPTNAGQLSYRKYKQLQFTKIKVIEAYNGMADSNIKLIPQCPNLQEIKLIGNQLLENVDFLHYLASIKILNLSSNKIRNVDGLRKLVDIDQLDLSENVLQNVSGLSSVTTIKKLYLYCNLLQNVDGLTNITNINILDLNKNRIKNVDGLSNLTNVNTLSLVGNQLQNVDGLSNLTTVNTLNLIGNRLQNVDGLYSLTTVNTLDLRDNQLQNVDGLSNLTTVYTLNLNGNKLQNVDGLSSLTTVNTLGLNSNQLQNLDGLAKCTQIKRLYIQNNKIQAIPKFIALFANLFSLSVSKNQITTLPQFLSQNKNLTDFKFDGCPIQQIECIEWFKNQLSKNQVAMFRKELSLERLASQQLKVSSTKKFEKTKSQAQGIQIEQSSFSKQMQQLKVIQEQLKQAFDTAQSFAICFKKTISITKQMIFKSYQIQVWQQENKNQQTLRLRELLKRLNLEDIVVSWHPIDLLQLPSPQGFGCWKCKRQLTAPYYWLKWERETLFGCKQCVEKTVSFDTQKHHFAYQKNSILIPAQLSQTKAPARHLGLNLQPQPGTISQNKKHKMCCSACKGTSQLGKPRYICLICKSSPLIDVKDTGGFVDLCEDCLQKYLEDDKSVSEALESNKHKQDHLWLRVLYNTQGYYKY